MNDGTRTHDDRNHNPGLYQLSYAHHKSGVSICRINTVFSFLKQTNFKNWRLRGLLGTSCTSPFGSAYGPLNFCSCKVVEPLLVRVSNYTTNPKDTLQISFGLARLRGLEPLTPGLEGRCSIRLSYRRIQTSIDCLFKMVGAEGFEPPTLCSQSRCATRLRYAPIFLYSSL